MDDEEDDDILQNTRKLKEWQVVALINMCKWKKGVFICHKCGNEMYKKGKKWCNRRCTKCDYDESVLKFTAFEGLHIPLSKAYYILEEIVKHSYSDSNDKVHLIKNKSTYTNQNGKEVKEEQYQKVSWTWIIDRWDEENYSSEEKEDELHTLRERFKPKIRKLSRDFEVEENTIRKLMERIGHRISESLVSEEVSALPRIIQYLDADGNYDDKVMKLFGMLSLPLVGKWRYGRCQINWQWYTMSVSFKDVTHSRGWKIYPMRYKELLLEEDPELYYHSEILEAQVDYEHPIEYGTREWFEVFGMPKPQLPRDIDKGAILPQKQSKELGVAFSKGWKDLNT